MALNSKYIAAFSFEEVILDKDNAFPLANGLVYFYKDQARTQLKDIFQLVGAPTYSYIKLPNPVKLSSIGTFQDISGNDIVPYFYPYDSTNNVELYYVAFYSSADGITPDVFQFAREAVPSSAVTSGGEVTSENKNYIPDGQFLLHTNIPDTDTTDAGEVVSDVTVLSQGGWTFERSTGAVSKDLVLFNPIVSAITNPTGNPKFTCDCICEIPDINASYKTLRVKFYDVNKFASDTDEYTISFTAKSNAGSPKIDVNLIKNFGTGGSPSPTTSTSIISDLTIGTSFTMYNYPFKFLTNIGKTLGTNRDDYLQIEFSFPPSSAYNIEITDVSLVKGAVTLTSFPIMANDEMLSRSLTGWADIPAYDGSNLYLPLMLTPSGLSYDNSMIGKVMSTSQDTLGKGELWADGSQYKTVERSSDYIPYSRLQSVLWMDSINTPKFGTGATYMTAVYKGTDEATTEEIIIANNTAGTVTNASDGAVATTFTITNVADGAASRFIKTFGFSSTGFYIENIYAGDGTIDAGTSGFTVADNITGHDGATSILYNVMSVVTIAATGLASKYFKFVTSHSSSLDSHFYVWYTVDGTGSDPAPGGGGTGIKVALYSTDTANVVCLKTQLAITGAQVTSVLTVAASAIPAGSYFNIYTTADHFYVWYKKDGTGTEPIVSGAKGIQVDILSSDTNLLVANKTQIAINMVSFAVPDIRGMFIRAQGGGTSLYDPDSAIRYSAVPGLYGDFIGTLEYDQNMIHRHGFTGPTGNDHVNGGNQIYVSHEPSSTSTGDAGYNESRPINISFKYIIKY